MPEANYQIAALIPPVTAFGRGLLRGVIQYALENGRWRFVDGGANPPLGYHMPVNQRIDGAIGQFHTPEARAAAATLTVPVVNTSAATLPLPTVASDYERAGRLAADHLLECGFRHFAYWGGQWLPSSIYNGFYLRLREAGFDAHWRKIDDRQWDNPARDTQEWIDSLPKPLGVLGGNDALGLNVLRACDQLALRVPEDVGVIGLTNDELLCDMCTPPLSSVALAVERQGYVAAELLARMMSGEPAPDRPIFISPQGIVARQSTDVLLVKDQEVAQAVKFIRRHATDPIRVEDVLRVVPISRRSLESRFKRAIGRGPAAEIRQVQLQQAKHLLAFTNMPIVAVAGDAGFSSPEYMARVFQREVGTSPREYRIHGRTS